MAVTTVEQWRAKYGSHGLMLMVEGIEESCNNGSLPSEGMLSTLATMAKELSAALQNQAPPRDDLGDGLREVWAAMSEHEDGRPITLVAEATDHWVASILVGSQAKEYQMGGAADPKTALSYLAHQVRVYREERGA